MTDDLRSALAAVRGYLEKAEAAPGAVGTKFGREPGGYMRYAQLRLVLEAASTLTSQTRGTP